MNMDDYSKDRFMHEIAPGLKCQLEDAIWAAYPFVRININRSYHGDAVIEARWSLFDTAYGHNLAVDLCLFESDADKYKQYIFENLINHISSAITSTLVSSRPNRNKA